MGNFSKETEEEIKRVTELGRQLKLKLNLPNVDNRRELLITFFDIATEDDIQECINGFAGRVYDRLKSNL